MQNNKYDKIFLKRKKGEGRKEQRLLPENHLNVFL